MSRVLFPAEAEWYDELKAVAYYGEFAFEREIRQHLHSLFPDFYVFPFKAKVTSRSSAQVNKPDLAMIRRDFKAWGVIEVELAEHDIRHVLEQTRCFSDGNYNAPEIAQYIRRQLADHCDKRVSLNRLEILIEAEMPTVLVIVDEHKPDWEQQLRAEGVALCVFQIFKNTRGQHIYRTLGAYPVVPKHEAHCRAHARLSNVVEIIGDFEFKKLRKNRQVDVMFHTTLTQWSLFDDNGKNYLRFLGKINPLKPSATYTLLADRAHNYHFKIN